jgi:uncharacterized protein (TIGR03663 family)
LASTAFETRDRDGVGASFLDRGIALGALSWATGIVVAAIAVAAALRLAGLDALALGREEASRSFDAWLLYQGRPPLPGERLPETAPFFVLLQALSFFLFGTTDVTARLMPALLGIGVVLLALALRPFVGRAAALGMAALAAFSPTLVFASRMATPEIAVAFLTLLFLTALLFAGRTDPATGARGGWAATAGASLAALIGSGPSALTALVALGVGLAVAASTERDGAVRRGLAAVTGPRGAAPAAVAFLATLLVLFTRFFSDLGAITGVGQTIADWGNVLAERSVETPTQFFLFAALLYEPLAVLFAVVAALRGRASRDGGLGWPLFGAWFVAALLLWSFSSGREPQHAVHVALPLVLLGGAVLGDLLAALDRRDFSTGPGGALALALLGFLIGLTSATILLGRVDAATDQRAAALQVAVVATLVVVPLAYVVFVLVGRERATGRGRQPAILALLVVALLLGALTLRSAILLNFYRANNGTELLAQTMPTDAVRPLVERLDRLSRDQSVTDGSVRDVTGGNGMSIAVDRTVRWPFQWYFRDFPNFAVVDAGQAPLADAHAVIAPDEVGLAEAGYTPRAYPWLTRVPPAYAAPDTSAIVGTLVDPSRWVDAARFLLYREGIDPAPPETVAVGLNAELAAQVFPATGPFDLADRPGAGSAPGQFEDPIGVATAGDGTTYVVDQGNARVQRFSADGGFVGIWGGAEGEIEFARTENGLGPTGIAVGPDDLVYVADTWNHRVVVLSPSGEIVRELGAPAGADGTREAADIGDDPGAVDDDAGAFFGPRAVAVSDDEVFVVDTGNERVQVFAIDGTFRRAWGGYGSDPGQLIEPVGIALDAAGRVYVADSGNARVSLFDREGRPLAQWPIAAWPSPDPGGARPDFQPYVAFDAAGNLYATSADTGEVVVLAPDGRPIETIDRANGDSLGRPVGVAVGPGGDVLITDLESDAVVRYVPAPAPPVAIVDRPPDSPETTGEDPPGAAPTSAPLPRPPGQGS